MCFGIRNLVVVVDGSFNPGFISGLIDFDDDFAIKSVEDTFLKREFFLQVQLDLTIEGIKCLNLSKTIYIQYPLRAHELL